MTAEESRLVDQHIAEKSEEYWDYLANTGQHSGNADHMQHFRKGLLRWINEEA